MHEEPATLRSMTGFGASEGGAGPWLWRWEARSVNGRGLDLRLRLPEGWDALEPALRRALQARLRRGAVTIGLRLSTATSGGVPALDPVALAAAVAATEAAARAAAEAGLAVAPVAPERLLSLRGVWREGGADGGALAGPDEATLAQAAGDFARALDALDAARAAEGAALGAAFDATLSRIDALRAGAAAAHAAQAAAAPEGLRARVAALVGAGATPPQERLAAELALLAVKADVQEELDRLASHVAAVRALLGRGGAVGRELDFLTQELNREANTLCAKSASAALTAAGVALKVQIDQLREQAANLE